MHRCAVGTYRQDNLNTVVGCWPIWGEEVAYTYTYMYMYAYAIYVHMYTHMNIREEEERRRQVYSKQTGEEKGFIDTKHHTWIECVLARRASLRPRGRGVSGMGKVREGRLVRRWYVSCFSAACEASANSDIGMCSP